MPVADRRHAEHDEVGRARELDHGERGGRLREHRPEPGADGEDLQADAERKHTEVMNTVKQQQTALEARISELRTFEREYRTRLKTLLESQLEELATRGTAAPNGEAGNN